MSKLFKFGLGFLLIGLAVVLIVSTTTSSDLFVVDDENYTFYEKDYEFDELSSFYLDFDNRNVNILESEDNKVHLKYYIHDKDLVEYEVSEKELNFTISRKWYYNIFSFDIFSSKEYFKVYLYIPSGMNINILDVSTSNGKVDFDVDNIFDIIRLTSSNGRIDISNLTATNIKASTSNGDITLNDITINDFINLDSSNGDIILSSVTAKEIEADTSNGKIDAQDIISDDIVLDSSNGRIYLSVKGDKDDYRVTLSTSNGDKIYDGLKIESGTVNTSGTKFISIDSSNGDVEVTFIN